MFKRKKKVNWRKAFIKNFVIDAALVFIALNKGYGIEVLGILIMAMFGIRMIIKIGKWLMSIIRDVKQEKKDRTKAAEGGFMEGFSQSNALTVVDETGHLHMNLESEMQSPKYKSLREAIDEIAATLNVSNNENLVVENMQEIRDKIIKSKEKSKEEKEKDREKKEFAVGYAIFIGVFLLGSFIRIYSQIIGLFLIIKSFIYCFGTMSYQFDQSKYREQIEREKKFIYGLKFLKDIKTLKKRNRCNALIGEISRKAGNLSAEVIVAQDKYHKVCKEILYLYNQYGEEESKAGIKEILEYLIRYLEYVLKQSKRI